MRSYESDSDDEDLAFASMDFAGVDFDTAEPDDLGMDTPRLPTENESRLKKIEEDIALGSFRFLQDEELCQSIPSAIIDLGRCLEKGDYRGALRSETASQFFKSLSDDTRNETSRVAKLLRERVIEFCQDIESCVLVQFLSVAAFQLFLQLNYTGPTLEQMARQNLNLPSDNPDNDKKNPLDGIDPHPSLRGFLGLATDTEEDTSGESIKLTAPKRNVEYQNRILSELAVDGEWPCPVCHAPYLLLVARSLLLPLSGLSSLDWTVSIGRQDSSSESRNDRALDEHVSSPIKVSASLNGAKLWAARTGVAHQRLIQSTEPSATLWEEVRSTFQSVLEAFCKDIDTNAPVESNFVERQIAATVVLEWGLAQHYFDRVSKGKLMFRKAMEYSGVTVEVTGAEGKRTKFQQKLTAQMLVRAVSMAKPKEAKRDTDDDADDDGKAKERIVSQGVKHSEDEILLEKVKFQNKEDNEIQELATLDQAILLALCLDVKNSNPADGLTSEEMGAYLARLLDHQDDWMIYSTGLLERAWLEFEGSHSRERALLQLQALADQHTNRLTLTQSTFESVEDSAPPQDRLRHLNTIVYPPRWEMLQDIAERYASLGIVTSAAEIFSDIELWDEAVECYRRAGKEALAEKLVRERLDVVQTPRMWVALGDLTHDPQYYQKSLDLSNGRYANAYVALGQWHFDKGELSQAGDNYRSALKLKPLMPNVWFRLGTISMQVGDWDTALTSFSEVVQQEAEESDAWANVAAVHLHNKRPAEAYPALNESLKYSRNNWRVWVTKLYTCIDLEKYDEAIQSCQTLMDLKSKQNSEVPELEEKCVRAIVGGTLKNFQESQGDKYKLESARRSLSRLYDLLDRLSTETKTEPWVWESLAYFNQQVGRDEQVLENLMKEYRALQSIQGWENDKDQMKKVVQVLSQIVHFNKLSGEREGLTKARFLLRGAKNKIRKTIVDESSVPADFSRLEELLRDVENRLVEQ